jgi:hypothetical protein
MKKLVYSVIKEYVLILRNSTFEDREEEECRECVFFMKVGDLLF